jgi:hypothetical protein
MSCRVAVVGAGRRVRQNFLPAAAALGDGIEVVGIASRGHRSAEELGDAWGIPAVKGVAAFDWDDVDAVVVSVATSQVPNVLRQLEPYGEALDLVLDTPPFAGPADVRWARLFKGFRRTLIAEDFMRFPQFDLLRAAVDAGAVGEPRRVVLRRTGFLYHGMALARSFFGFREVRSFRTRPGARTGRDVRYVLHGGGVADVETPYEPESGAVIVVGSDGTLRAGGDTADDEAVSAPGPVAAIAEIERDGAVTGFALETRVGRFEHVPRALAALRAMDLEDDREFNLAKTCGTASVLRQLESSGPGPYGPADAIYDTVVSSLAARLPAWGDPGGVAAAVGWRVLGRSTPAIHAPDVLTSV